MKKTIFALVVVFIIALIAMPYVTGKVAHSETEKLVDRMNQDTAQFGYTEITSYERSYKSTQSSFKYLSPLGDDELEINYSCGGNHGVLSYAFECKIDSFEEYQEVVNKYLEGQDPLSVSGAVSVFGKIKQKVMLDAIQAKGTGGESVSFEGGDFDVTTNKGLNSFLVSGKLGALNILESNGNVSLDGSTLNMDIDVADDGLQFGNGNINIDKLKVIAEKDNTFQLAKMNLAFSAKENGDNIDFNYNVSGEGVETASDANRLSLDKVFLKFIVNGFDRSSAVKLNDIVKDISEGGDVTPQQQAVVISAMEGTLKKGLNIKLDVNANAQKEEFVSNLDIRLIEDSTLADFSTVLYNPESILEKMNLSVTANIPDSFLPYVGPLAFVIPTSPLFNRQGEVSKTDISLKKNDISLNGEKISFQELITLLQQR